MTETYLTFKLTHKRPLPDETAEVVAQRIYNWLISRGVESGVEPVIRPEMQALPVKGMHGDVACAHRFVRDDEHPTYHGCQRCGEVRRDHGK